MRRVRVIPVLLLSDEGVVKTAGFKNPKYIGDPINTVKIFNEKEVDELMVLDIDISRGKKSIDFSFIEEMASEAFMPIAYGGGLYEEEDIDKAIHCGLEKVVLNTGFWQRPTLALNASKRYGSQSISIAMDVKKSWNGKYQLFSSGGKSKLKLSVQEGVKMIEEYGGGEIILTSIQNEGFFKGYDLSLLNMVSELTELPVVANGGSRSIQDFLFGIESGASAVAAGSQFVYTGNKKGILITYPNQATLTRELYNKIA